MEAGDVITVTHKRSEYDERIKLTKPYKARIVFVLDNGNFQVSPLGKPHWQIVRPEDVKKE